MKDSKRCLGISLDRNSMEKNDPYYKFIFNNEPVEFL